MMRRLKRTEVKKFKAKLYKQQEGVCPLCLEELPEELSKCALDHNHVTGECRGLLHLGCNKVEGSLFNSIGRWGGTGKDYDKVIPYAERLIEYLKSAGTGFIYHLHKTPEEKAQADRERRRRASARRRAKARQEGI